MLIILEMTNREVVPNCLNFCIQLIPLRYSPITIYNFRLLIHSILNHQVWTPADSKVFEYLGIKIISNKTKHGETRAQKPRFLL